MRDAPEESEPVVGPQAVPLKRCLSCGYDLRGLAPGHTCPECGKGIGLGAWSTGGGRVVWQRLLAIWIIASLPLLFHLIFQLKSGTSSLWTIAALVVIAGILAVAAIILKRLSRPPARHDIELVLSAHGLTVHPRRGKSIDVPWSNLGSVGMGRDLSGLRLLTLQQRRRGWLPVADLSFIIDAAQIDAEALRRQIERLIADSGSPGGSPSRGISRRSSHLIFA
jgi:hypothetical protein